VIVPDGVLFGSSNAHKQARQILIDNCELQGVISMPSGVFKPYAGVSTAVLLFVKGGQTENVWFYDMQNDGYSLDDKRDKIEGSDMPDIINTWQDRAKAQENDRKAKHFLVSVEEIIENGYDLSINRYKEIVYEEVRYDTPDAIIRELKDLDAERVSLLKNLELLIDD